MVDLESDVSFANPKRQIQSYTATVCLHMLCKGRTVPSEIEYKYLTLDFSTSTEDKV